MNCQFRSDRTDKPILNFCKILKIWKNKSSFLPLSFEDFRYLKTLPLARREDWRLNPLLLKNYTNQGILLFVFPFAMQQHLLQCPDSEPSHNKILVPALYNNPLHILMYSKISSEIFITNCQKSYKKCEKTFHFEKSQPLKKSLI